MSEQSTGLPEAWAKFEEAISECSDLHLTTKQARLAWYAGAGTALALTLKHLSEDQPNAIHRMREQINRMLFSETKH